MDLFLRAVSMLFQIYLSGRIGAAGLGLLQLILTVGMLGMTLGLSGVRTAVMYLCAEEYGKRRFSGMRRAAELCILWSVVCSLLAAAALSIFAPLLSAQWLHDLRAVSGLRILALSLPVRCYISVLAGYFTACGKVRQLTLIEAAEQIFSLLFTVFLLRAVSDAERACCAVLLGSFCAALVSAVWLSVLLCRDFRRCGPSAGASGYLRRLFRLCVPLALGDYLRSGLRTLEQLLIPLGLRRSGGSAESAMAAYGTIHAMVFPILMFPSAILASLSDLLIPELACCRAEERAQRIRALCEKCLRFAAVFASAAAVLEWMLAQPAAQLFYHSREAGLYLRLFAPLILILYPDMIVDGMCKGLGRQAACVRNNTITSVLDIALLYLLLPRLGVDGYLLAFSVTHVLNFYLSFRLLSDACGCHAHPVFLLKTACCTAAAAGCCFLLQPQASELLDIFVCILIFFGIYLPMLTLLDVFPPDDRRWLRRCLLPRKHR